MDVTLIGAQISKFRKALGMTQEELGKAVGVSTQAVSRWECGGAPDVSLFPAIAHTLHVTIDALFGQEGGEVQDFDTSFHNWLWSQEKGTTLKKLSQLIWNGSKALALRGIEVKTDVQMPDTCLITGDDGEPALLGSTFENDEGVCWGVSAEDLNFMTVFAEPEGGFGPFLDSCDNYRRLFSALSVPKALEVLLDMESEKPRLILPETVAKRLDIGTEETAAAMAALEGAHLLEGQELELPTGVVRVYQLTDVCQVVPFLLLARLLGQGESMHIVMVLNRDKPRLRWPENGTGAEKE